jgi:hypothetical protein
LFLLLRFRSGDDMPNALRFAAAAGDASPILKLLLLLLLLLLPELMPLMPPKVAGFPLFVSIRRGDPGTLTTPAVASFSLSAPGTNCVACLRGESVVEVALVVSAHARCICMPLPPWPPTLQSSSSPSAVAAPAAAC